MDKIKIAFLIAVIAVLLTACGKPSGMDDTTYKLGVKALEVMDAYNCADLTADEANEKLQGIYDRLSSRQFGDDELTQDIQNGSVVVSILSYQITMSSGGDLTEEANALRKKLNK